MRRLGADGRPGAIFPPALEAAVINHVWMTRLDDVLGLDLALQETPHVLGLGGAEPGEEVEGTL